MANNRRPQMDYYEYKKHYEEMRLARGGQIPQQQEPVVEQKPEIETKPKGSLLSGIKRAVNSFGSHEDAALETVEKQENPRQEEPTQDVAAAETVLPEQPAIDLPVQEDDAVQPDDVVPEKAQDEPAAADIELEQDLPADEEEEEIDNPFADAAAKVKQWGSKLAGFGVKLKHKKEDDQTLESASEDEASVGSDSGQEKEAPSAQASQEPLEEKETPEAEEKHKSFSLFGRRLANVLDDEDDDDIAPSGGGIKLFGGRSSSKKEEEYDEDDEYDEDTVQDDGDEAAKDVQLLDLDVEEETEDTASAHENRVQEDDGGLTAQLSKDLDEEETTSRRERRARRKAHRKIKEESEEIQLPESDTEDEQEEDESAPVDEPTQLFRPIRKKQDMEDQRTRRFEPVRVADMPQTDDYADDEDDEDDDLPARRSSRRMRGNMRIYQDDDLEDEDSSYDDDYEKDFYDDDEDGFEEEHIGFGKRVLRFLRGLLLVALICLVAVLVLRQLEASGKLSLDLLRNSIGSVLPVEKVFPKPEEYPADEFDMDQQSLIDGEEPQEEDILNEEESAITENSEMTEQSSQVPIGVAISTQEENDPEQADEEQVEAVG